MRSPTALQNHDFSEFYPDTARYSRSTKTLALGRHQKCVAHVPGFLQARHKLCDVSQQKSQTRFCAQ